MVCFDFDYCYIVVDVQTGFATVRDIWDGLEIAELDSLDEALTFVAS